MARSGEKAIIMQAERTFGMRVFASAAGVFVFVALYLVVMSGLQARAARLGAVVLGAAIVAVWSTFGGKKFVRPALLGGAALYAALCAACGWRTLCDGFLILYNGGATAININVHGGAAFANVTYSVGADFLFSSVVSVLSGVAAAALSEKHAPAMAGIGCAIVFVMLFAGLYPAPYSVILLGVACAGTLAVGKELDFKAAACYLGVAAVALSAFAPCLTYDGSAAVGGLRSAIATAYDRSVFGSDSLPEGRLADAAGMRASDTPRLSVTLAAQTDKLYLKGFVGGAFADNAWSPTDKNEYVQNGFQGLLDHVADVGIPVSQYATYSALCGRSERYEITVKNIGARKKYVYAPYGTVEHSHGTRYYDLGLRGGAFTQSEYAFTVFDGDESGERVVQAQWLTDDINRTPAMTEYIDKEKEYRAFAYSAYARLTENVESALASDGASVNTVTQLIRARFLGAYRFSDTPDAIKHDFIEEFFGDGIVRANASYFATAATLIFRYYGYAARYVEGYLIQAGGDGVSDRTVEATDKNAHAWTEVYMDGVGWLPIEVTPTFFSDEDPDATVDPDDPDGADDNKPAVEPELPPDEPTDPVIPDEPSVKPPEVNPDADGNIVIALKALIAITSVLLAVAVVALIAAVRRRIVVRNKLRLLEAHGESFGRAAYGLAERECKSIGGVDADALSARGVDKHKTVRFMGIVERAVYGGHDPTDGERRLAAEFIELAGRACSVGGKPKRFIDKYVKCTGLDLPDVRDDG